MAKSSRPKSGKKRRSQPENSNAVLIGAGIGGGAVLLVGAVLIGVWIGGGSDQPQPAPVPDAQGVAEANPGRTNAPAIVPDSANESTTPELTMTNVPTSSSLPMPGSESALPDPGSGATSPMSDDGPADRPASELPLPDLIERVERSVVRIVVDTEFGGGIGSGFVVDKAGAIVTNYHVIEGARKADVEFRDGTKASVLGFLTLDAERDLAVIVIETTDKPLYPIAIAGDLPRKGEKVATFGAPRGLSFSTSEGIVSALRDAKEVGHEKGTFIQTTAAISGGNSGGPLTNHFGEVVGANTFKRTDGESLNFAISCLDIKQIVEARGDKLTGLSPEAIPVKISGGYGGAENIVGTERARVVLSQIREAAIVMAPFNYDPTGRITDYVMSSAERTLEDRMKWKKVTRTSQLKGSTAVVFVAMYFSLTEGKEENLVSDLNVQTVIVARDVDKDGKEHAAIVWDQKKTVGTVALKALISGVVSRAMETGVKDYFGGLYADYRKAVREVQ